MRHAIALWIPTAAMCTCAWVRCTNGDREQNTETETGRSTENNGGESPTTARWTSGRCPLMCGPIGGLEYSPLAHMRHDAVAAACKRGGGLGCQVAAGSWVMGYGEGAQDQET